MEPSSQPAAKPSSLALPLVAGLILATLAGYVGWTVGSAQADVGAAAASARDRPLPPILTKFRMPTLEGGETGPADFKGQVVVVDFWATWCAPCRVQAKIMEPLVAEMKPDGVQFLAVSMGEDKDTVARFVADHPYSYPVLYDSEDRIALEAEVYTLPTLLVIDRSGDVEYFEPGIADSAALRQAVERAKL